MKIKALLSLTLILTLFFSACEQWIDPEINIDPDNPVEVPVPNHMPYVQADLAFTMGGFDVVGPVAIWTQHVAGQDRQASAYQSYNFKTSDADNIWSQMYSGLMMDLKVILDKAENPDAPARQVAGVGKVMMAICLAYTADTWGAAPYDEAFQGLDNLEPAFNTQQELYDRVNTLLTEAIADLQVTESLQNNISLTSDFYLSEITPDGRDYTKWVMAAYTLRARYAMHLTKVGGVDYAEVLSDLQNGITTIDDDMQFEYGTPTSENNPLYKFIINRSGYVGNNQFFQGIMLDDSAGGADNYGAVDPRASLLTWSTDGFWTSRAAPVALVQATEAMFLAAEAEFRREDEVGARDSLKNAVAMSMAKYGVSDPTWMAGFEAAADAASKEDLLELIMTQKYIHMFLQYEAWNDWRRTGYPALTPNVGSDIPRRFPYPGDEILFNPNTPEVASIFTPNWWDQ